MVGFYARADASAPIRVDLDNELEGMIQDPVLELLLIFSRRTMV